MSVDKKIKAINDICKLYIDGNASVILMNKIDYERLLSDSFFVRDGKNRDSAGVLTTTNTFIEKD